MVGWIDIAVDDGMHENETPGGWQRPAAIDPEVLGRPTRWLVYC
jgi:hypothetical protein